MERPTVRYNCGRMSLVCRRCVVSGRVQGVGYRNFVREVASREKVSGYVRNLSDGSVEVVLCGGMESIERVERSLLAGPSAARVDGVESTLRPLEAFQSEFEIRATMRRTGE